MPIEKFAWGKPHCHICGKPSRENKSVSKDGYTAYYHSKCLKKKFPWIKKKVS